jgi:tetratricopeptide (TPR) repeat protein
MLAESASKTAAVERDISQSGLTLAVTRFKRGETFEAIQILRDLPRSATTYFYLLKCYRSLMDLGAVISVIREFSAAGVFLPVGYSSGSAVSVLARLNSADAISQIGDIFKWHHPGIKANIAALEGFFWTNHALIAGYRDLAQFDRRILSNCLSLLGDAYAHLGRHRIALDLYHAATELFQDSAYSRVSFAELAYATVQRELCVAHLRHVNHLLYYVGNRPGYVYNPYSDEVVPVGDSLFARFARLSGKCGFRYG